MWFHGVDYVVLAWTFVLGGLGHATATRFRGLGGDAAGAALYGGVILVLTFVGMLVLAVVSAWRHGLGHGALTFGYGLVVFVGLLWVFVGLEQARNRRWRAMEAAKEVAKES